MEMMEIQDPLVQACSDFYNGQKDAKLLINSDKADTEEVMVSYFFRTFEEMPAIEQYALNECKGSVLDIGAGAGSHSLYLQNLGLDTSALEIKPGLAEIIRKRGVDKVLCEDIFNLTDKQYDTLLLLMNGVGLVGDFKGLERFLSQARKLLKKGGSIILDSSDLLYLYEEEDGSFLIDLNAEYYGIVEYNFEYKGLVSENFKWLYIDFEQLKFYAENAGFNCEMLMEGDYYNYLARLY